MMRGGRTVGTGKPRDEPLPRGRSNSSEVQLSKELQEVKTAHRGLPDLYETGTTKLQSGTAKETKLAVTRSATVRLPSHRAAGTAPSRFSFQSNPCTRGWNRLQVPLAEGPSCWPVFFWEGPLVWCFKIDADVAVAGGFLQLPGAGCRLSSDLVMLWHRAGDSDGCRGQFE